MCRQKQQWALKIQNRQNKRVSEQCRQKQQSALDWIETRGHKNSQLVHSLLPWLISGALWSIIPKSGIGIGFECFPMLLVSWRYNGVVPCVVSTVADKNETTKAIVWGLAIALVFFYLKFAWTPSFICSILLGYFNNPLLHKSTITTKLFLVKQYQVTWIGWLLLHCVMQQMVSLARWVAFLQYITI